MTYADSNHTDYYSNQIFKKIYDLAAYGVIYKYIPHKVLTHVSKNNVFRICEGCGIVRKLVFRFNYEMEMHETCTCS